MKISLCTFAKNRTHNLKQVYIKNIEENISVPDIEFVLVNYTSDDDMDEWASLKLKEYIDSGLVNYYKTNQFKYIHRSHGKNVAHLLGQGDFLLNIDADNYAGPVCKYLKEHLREKQLYHFFKTDKGEKEEYKKEFFSSYGKIGCWKKDFMRIGGYDEALRPKMLQDKDIIKRLQMLRCRYRRVENIEFSRAIINTEEERFSTHRYKESRFDMKEFNKTLVRYHCENRIWKVNEYGFGRATVYKNFGTEPIQVGEFPTND